MARAKTTAGMLARILLACAFLGETLVLASHVHAVPAGGPAEMRAVHAAHAHDAACPHGPAERPDPEGNHAGHDCSLCLAKDAGMRAVAALLGSAILALGGAEPVEFGTSAPPEAVPTHAWRSRGPPRG